MRPYISMQLFMCYPPHSRQCRAAAMRPSTRRRIRISVQFEGHPLIIRHNLSSVKSQLEIALGTAAGVCPRHARAAGASHTRRIQSCHRGRPAGCLLIISPTAQFVKRL